MLAPFIAGWSYNRRSDSFCHVNAMFRLLISLVVLLNSSLLFAEDWTVRRQVAGSFADVKEAVVMAIENRGLVINYTSHIADMLARTGADIGASRRIYEQAEIIEFCSAGLSRKMMELDPHNIVFCPFALSVYTLPGETGQVWLSYRRPQGGAAPLVEELLAGVVGEAAR